MTSATHHPAPEASRRPRVVGIVGGIGSGKSRVTRILADAGAFVISGDELAHEALRQPEVREQVVRRWGPQVLGEDGEVRRRALGSIVFGDAAELRALEALVHPWIEHRIREEMDKARRDPSTPLVVLDAAVMLEAGWDGVCDELVYVDVPRELRLRRIAEQRGWSEEEVARRERAQLPAEVKARRADHVLDNAGSLNDLTRQVHALLCRWGVSATANVKGPSTP
jgi:dephospho-CoA kinase